MSYKNDSSISSISPLDLSHKSVAMVYPETALNKKRQTRMKIASKKPTLREKIKKAMGNPRTRLRVNDTVAAVVGILGVVIAYWENEEFYKEITEEQDGKTVITKARNESNDTCTAMRSLNMLVTIFLLVFIVLHYIILLNVMRMQRKATKTDTLKSSGLQIYLVIEILICMWCTPPKLDTTFEGYMLGGKYTYSFDAIIFCIMLARVYLVSRLFYQYSRWSKPDAMRICAKYKVEPTTMFAIKCEFKFRPLLMISLAIVACLLVMGSAIRALEQPYEGEQKSSLDFKYLTNAMWLIIITMTTVGYGDGYPSTHLGRLIAAGTCIFGMLLVSLVVVALTDLTSLSNQEGKAFHTLKILRHRRNLQEKAAVVITNAARFYQATVKRNTRMRISYSFIYYLKLRRAIKDYSNDDKIAANYALPHDEVLLSLQNKMEDDLDEMRVIINEIVTIKDRVKELSITQAKVSRVLDDVYEDQLKVAEKLVTVHNMFAVTNKTIR